MKLKKSSVPLYYQLEKILRKRIMSGQIKAGDSIPTERELCDEFGVSRTTVRQALAKLEDVDLIRREQGRGTFVTTRSYSNIHYKLYGHMNDLFTFGAATALKMISKKAVVPDVRSAKEMGLEPGERVFLFEGLRLLDETNRAFFKAYVPEAIGAKIPMEEVKTPFLISLVEKAALETAKTALQEISAQVASEQLADVMGVQTGSPLLVIKRIYYTAEENVLEVAVTYFPGEVFKSVARLDKISTS